MTITRRMTGSRPIARVILTEPERTEVIHHDER
jgi:hypothetical protein